MRLAITMVTSRGETIYQYIDILQYLLLQYNTIQPIENIDILRTAIYCNILLVCARYCVAFSRLKNKMTNKCIKVIISACLWLSAFISYIENV